MTPGLPSTPSVRRRAFLKQGLGGAVALSCGVASDVAALEPELEMVDTHTHFYDPSRPQGVPWPQPGTPLYRTVLPEDWKKLAAPLGIHKTVVVEASKWVEDNQWILDLAAQEKCIVGFVGNLDPGAPEFNANLKKYAANAVFRGIRVSSQSLTQGLDKPEYVASLKLLTDHDLSLDVVGGGALLDSVDKLAVLLPGLRIMVDHVGGAGDPSKVSDAWKQGIKASARHRNVWCKVSGLVEAVGAGKGTAPPDAGYYAPVLDFVWHAFGEDRVVFGSNWPVSDRGAPFATVFQIVKQYFGSKGRETERKYFAANGREVYRYL